MKEFYILINSLAQGGAERVASELSWYVEEKGYTPIFLLTDGYAVEYDIAPSSRVEVLPLCALSRTGLFLVSVFVQAIYIRYSIRGGVNLISFLHRANIVNCLSGAWSRRNVVVSERSLFSKSYSGFKRLILKLLLKFCYSRADSIVAISELVKLELVDNLAVRSEKICVLNNPVNYSQFNFKGACRELGSDDAVRFCCVGRMVKSKRHFLVIKLFHKLSIFFPQAELHLCGDGPERESLELLARQLGVENRCYFYGKVEDVSSVLNHCDVFLFFSEFESFGNVATEALACGLPVIYSENLLSFDEIFRGSTVLSYSAKQELEDADVREMVDYLVRFDRALYCFERLAQLERFDRVSIFSKYLDRVVA